jgi:YebC/PmpR family DNA-binding regulatory protein
LTLSGHSKWHNIKLRKGKADAQRGALFTKLSREIILAAKTGSSDPEANHSLKMAVEKARAGNMPMDNIKRAIARANGSGEREIEEIRYEGYGPSGIAIVVDVATDNRNRAAAEVRYMFSRHEGALGETNSVAWMFDPRGILHVVPDAKLDEDAFTELVLVDGVVDVGFGEVSQVVTEASELGAVREILQAKGLKITEAYLGVVAKTTVSPEGEELRAALALLDALEDHEDVQRVFSNLEVSEAALEALA